MRAESFILAMLAQLPNREVKGKKRLHKLIFLLIESGAECDARFELKDFGPFSLDVARSADFLSLTGAIEEKEEPVGFANNLATVFRLSERALAQAPALDANARQRLNCFNQLETVELEVAATLRYFQKHGSSASEAEGKTQRMKPTKTAPPVLQKAKQVLRCLER